MRMKKMKTQMMKTPKMKIQMMKIQILRTLTKSRRRRMAKHRLISRLMERQSFLTSMMMFLISHMKQSGSLILCQNVSFPSSSQLLFTSQPSQPLTKNISRRKAVRAKRSGISTKKISSSITGPHVENIVRLLMIETQKAEDTNQRSIKITSRRSPSNVDTATIRETICLSIFSLLTRKSIT